MGVKHAKPVAELPDDLGKIAAKFRAYNFPFKNLVLEGGGAKGIAYIGAMKVLEAAGIMENIDRFAGTSAGAITAGLMSLGMTSDEILEEMRNVDLERTLMESPWWSRSELYLCLKLFTAFGGNRGDMFFSWYGDVIQRHLDKHHRDKKLDRDINLSQLRNVFGKELCTVTYNLTFDIDMYRHAKTTPLCSVRQAVRQSMSLPVVYIPFKFEDEPDLYIDGGVCANFPLYCYDGWWLSMDVKDSFQSRLERQTDDVKTTSYFYLQSNEARFQPENVSEEQRKQQLQKTLGLMMYSKNDRRAYQHVFSERLDTLMATTGGDLKNKRPETKLKKKYQKKEEKRSGEERELNDKMREDSDSKRQRLNEVLKAPRNREDMLQCFKDKFPNKKELRDFRHEADSYEVVFDDLFAKYPGGPVTDETINAIYTNWAPFRKKLMEVVPQRIIDTPFELSSKYVELVGKSKPIKEEDVGRCIGIDVDYVGTFDFDMEPEDQTFLMRQGALATLAFLEDYVKRYNLHPSDHTPVGPSLVRRETSL